MGQLNNGVIGDKIKAKHMICAGLLDLLSYMSAATANLIFADAAIIIGWGWLILVWFGLMIVGVIVAIPDKNAVKFAKLKQADTPRALVRGVFFALTYFVGIGKISILKQR